MQSSSEEVEETQLSSGEVEMEFSSDEVETQLSSEEMKTQLSSEVETQTSNDWMKTPPASDDSGKSSPRDDDEDSEDDAFLIFIINFKKHAKSHLCETSGSGKECRLLSWNWIATQTLGTCVTIGSGVTSAIFTHKLSQTWENFMRKPSDVIAKLKMKHEREKLPNNITIDSIFEKKSLPYDSVIEAVIDDVISRAGMSDITCLLRLGDIWSSKTIKLYLLSRFSNMVGQWDIMSGLLKRGREVFLTGCTLSENFHLQPTEYFVVLLDENDKNDAAFLASSSFVDSFSKISLHGVKEGAPHSIYARITHIEPLQVVSEYDSLLGRQITVVDNDGMTLNFLLRGGHGLIANLLSIGSMLGVDKPFVKEHETSGELYLEYGSETQLFLRPIIPYKELMGPSIPHNEQDSTDLSTHLLRVTVDDLAKGNLTGISLYGIVTDILESEGIYSLGIEVKNRAEKRAIGEMSQTIWAKLHFVKSWSIGRLGIGHTICIFGLSCGLPETENLQLSWNEENEEASFFNLSDLLGFLNSSILHLTLYVSDLSICKDRVEVCLVWLHQIRHCHVHTGFMHKNCGHLVDNAPDVETQCIFCGRVCDGEVESTFYLEITVADDSGNVSAWCVGQPAIELLQISPAEFSQLTEEQQTVYLSSREPKKFMVAMANCRRGMGFGRIIMEQDRSTADWEVTCAAKFEEPIQRIPIEEKVVDSDRLSNVTAEFLLVHDELNAYMKNLKKSGKPMASIPEILHSFSAAISSLSRL